MRDLSFYFTVLFIVIWSCSQPTQVPKPRGHFRIDFPEQNYQSVNRIENNVLSGCPFTFEVPSYVILVPGSQKCWFDLYFQDFKTKLHVTYLPISTRSSLFELTEDARELAFKHAVKATGIHQSKIDVRNSQVGGSFYDISGNTASNIQFFLTDSTKHYLRAALYYEEKPNFDSIQPVLNFVRKDINHLINTFHWK